MKNEALLREYENNFLENDLLIDLSISKISKENEDIINKLIFTYLNNEPLDSLNKKFVRYDYDTKVILFNYIQKKIKLLAANKENISIKDLEVVISLLSLGKKYEISYVSKFSILDNLKKIFSDYNILLKELLPNIENYNITFNMYAVLLDVLYEYCIKLSKDIKTRFIISPLLQLVSNSINTFRFYHNISDKQRRKLNYLQGKMLFEFANINYICVNEVKQKKLIKIYENILNQIIDGHFMISSVLKSDKIQIHFLEKMTHTILLLFYKLNSYDNFDFKSLQKIQYLYRMNLNNNSKEYLFLEDFKKELLNNYTIMYDKQNIYNKDEILSSIIADKNISSSYLNIYQDLLLFCEFDVIVLKEQFLNTLILLEKDVLKVNIKLMKILDLLISKLLVYKEYNLEELIKRTLKVLFNRSQKNNFIDDSNVYFKLSYYYALQGKEHILMSEKLYNICEKRHFFSFLELNTKKIFQHILNLNSKSHFSALGFKSFYSKEEHIFIGNRMMENFFLFEELILKHNIKDYEKFLKKQLDNKELNTSIYLEELNEYLNKELFFNVMELYIFKNSIEEDYDFKEYHHISICEYSFFIKLKNSKTITDLDITYIRDRILELFICFMLNEDKAQNYNNYLQVSEYVNINKLLY